MKRFTTKKIIVIALLISVSIILTRFLSFYPTPTTRLSLGNLPVYLAGLLLGPLGGMITGALADIVGSSLLSPFGWYPPMTIPPMLVGLCSGLFSRYIVKSPKLAKLFLMTFSVNLVVNGLLGTLILSHMGGVAFTALLVLRLPIEVAKSVLEAFLLQVIYRPVLLVFHDSADDVVR